MNRRDFFGTVGVGLLGLVAPKFAEAKIISLPGYPATAKAWARFRYDGKIKNSYNIARITRVSEGSFTVEFMHLIKDAVIVASGK